MRFFFAALATSLVGLAAASSAVAAAVETDSLVRPAGTKPLTLAPPCCDGEAARVAAIQRLVVGVVARPAVQPRLTAPVARQVVRPSALVPGQIRSGRR